MEEQHDIHAVLTRATHADGTPLNVWGLPVYYAHELPKGTIIIATSIMEEPLDALETPTLSIDTAQDDQ